MKKNRNYPKVWITPKQEKRLRSGHPWIFRDEITKTEGNYQDGDLVDVLSSKGKYLGTGFINQKSKITVRLISRNTNDTFDTAFWKRRIEYALQYRMNVMPKDLNCFRLIFGEADFFPGLTVDKFNDVLVCQTLSLGIEKRKEIIFPLLVEVLKEHGFKIRGIYERNDEKIRILEGMEENKGWYPLEGMENGITSTLITENGLTYEVDFENGQKTGFFLDQKYNRRAVLEISKDKAVLDCFTHTGSFAMNAAKGGAKKIVAVDISETALEMAKKNIERNHLEDIIELQKADTFDYLVELEKKKTAPFDIIILDPPAFTKSRDTIQNAYRGYKEINYRAMKILPRGGFLVTASCSHFMREELFEKMLVDASLDAEVTLREVEVRKQSMDHPILPTVEETSYLKFYIFQIV